MGSKQAAATGGDGVGSVGLRLLGAFELKIDGVQRALPLSCQRVIAFLASGEAPVLRRFVAGTLWAGATETRAASNLRTALWRLGSDRDRLLSASRTTLALHPEVSVDLAAETDRWRAAEAGAPDLQSDATGALEYELLPDWYDDWLIGRQERWRQVRLHALESASRHHASARRYGLAIEFGLTAVAIDPLRESAHRAVIEAHLAEGNRAAAVRQFETFSSLLSSELGVAPTDGLLQELTQTLA